MMYDARYVRHGDPGEGEVKGYALNDQKRQFVKEARERLVELEQGLLNIESGQDIGEQIRLIFRGFHGIKGIAGYVNAREIVDLTNAGELLLMQVRDQNVTFKPAWIDMLLACHDHLATLLESFERGHPPGDDWKGSIDQLRKVIEKNDQEGKTPHPSSDQATFRESVDAHMGGLDVFLGKWKPGAADKRLISAVERKLKLFARAACEADRRDLAQLADKGLKRLRENKDQAWTQQQIDDFGRVTEQVRTQVRTVPESRTDSPHEGRAPGPCEEHSVRYVEVKSDYVDMLEALVQDFEVYTEGVAQHVERLKPLMKTRAFLWLDGMSSDLARFGHAFDESLRRLHLIPISEILGRFPRLVRDIAKREGKSIQLVTTGGRTELERVKAERLAEPLTHLIRNAVDHGIEDPEERVKAGKSENGKVELRAYRVEGIVTVEVRDDGRGIDFDSVRRKAIELGLATDETIVRYPLEELMNLIFIAGMSTKRTADTISGRGVGMGIVREALAELDGTVEVESQVGKGTTFRLKIPSDLSL